MSGLETDRAYSYSPGADGRMFDRVLISRTASNELHSLQFDQRTLLSGGL